MSAISKSGACSLCDESCNHLIDLRPVYCGLYCYKCANLDLPICYNDKENGECCICCKEKSIFKLPFCNHKVCLECCKNIYSYPREINYQYPEWPYKTTDNKQELFYHYEDTYFNYEENTYDELIEIRNNLIPERPQWMNTEEFINYENELFKITMNFIELENKWGGITKHKIRTKNFCPLCK